MDSVGVDNLRAQRAHLMPGADHDVDHGQPTHQFRQRRHWLSRDVRIIRPLRPYTGQQRPQNRHVFLVCGVEPNLSTAIQQPMYELVMVTT